MTFIYRDDPHNSDSGLMDLLDRLQAGDCIEVESFSCAAGSERSFLLLMEQLADRGIRFRSTREQFDTAAPEAASTLAVLKAIAHMNDSTEKEAPEAETDEAAEGSKGRRPISVDPDTFDAILKRWRSGEITARQAMNELGLKPNTFYRRVREKMSDVNGEEIFNAAKKLGKDFAETAKQEAAGFQESAEKFAADHDIDSISQNVIEQVGKGINSAGSFLSKSLEALTKEITAAVQHFETQLKEEAAAQNSEKPMDAQVEEVPEKEPAEEAVQVPAEAAENVEAAAEEPAAAEAPNSETPVEEAEPDEGCAQEDDFI